MDAERPQQRGVLTGDDMAHWQPTYEPPQTYDYHDWTVCKTGPWGQGPVFLQTLAMLKGFDLGKHRPDGRGLRPYSWSRR